MRFIQYLHQTNPLSRAGKHLHWRSAVLLFLSVFMLVFGSNTVRVFAAECPNGMSLLDCQALWGGWADWVPDNNVSCGAKSSSGAITVPPGQNSGTWTSGLNPPYILEQFMIETLKDIAKKEGVSETNAVTQQHVIGLMALAWGEGGGLTNDDFWNPFNTGINAPDLTVDGGHVGNGVQAFKSFDAGVEATARVMTGSTQGRLGITLTNPDSTALDFLTSWLDFPPKGPYPAGHYPWAEASDPSSPYFQPDYQQVRVKLIQQATQSYEDMASTIMRGKASDPSSTHDKSKLYFHALSTSAAAQQSSCAGGTGAFFDTAKAYAWPTYHSASYCVMRTAYANAVKAALQRMSQGQNDYVGGGSGSLPPQIVDGNTAPASSGSSCSGGHAGIDCGGFVTRVFRDSGADPKYNSSDGNVVAQYLYVSSHPNLYKRVSGSGLQSGDIFFASDLGHTYIYVGANGYPGYDSVSASFSTSGDSWRTPMASNAYDIGSATWYRPLFTLTASTTTTATGTNAPAAN